MLFKQCPIYVSLLEQKWSMYTSPLVAEQRMRWVSSLFGFVWLSVFRFKHHSPENRGHMLTTKIVHFVKLPKHETDYIIAFLSSRWSKNIYGTSNLESGSRSYAPSKIAPLSEVPNVGSFDRCQNFREAWKNMLGYLGLSPRREFRQRSEVLTLGSSGGGQNF